MSKVYVVKGDLLFTDYEICSVHKTRSLAEQKVLELEKEYLTPEELEENIAEYGFSGWIIEELNLED